MGIINVLNRSPIIGRYFIDYKNGAVGYTIRPAVGEQNFAEIVRNNELLGREVCDCIVVIDDRMLQLQRELGDKLRHPWEEQPEGSKLYTRILPYMDQDMESTEICYNYEQMRDLETCERRIKTSREKFQQDGKKYERDYDRIQQAKSILNNNMDRNISCIHPSLLR